jgi:predicted transcriptional regulator
MGHLNSWCIRHPLDEIGGHGTRAPLPTLPSLPHRDGEAAQIGVRHQADLAAGQFQHRTLLVGERDGTRAVADGAPADSLDKPSLRDYPCFMNIIRRTLDIDTDTDARLRQMADERGQDVAAVLAEAVALLDSVVDIAGPDIGEDRRRLDAFRQTRAAVPLDEVKTWVASWGSVNELPRPAPRKIG